MSIKIGRKSQAGFGLAETVMAAGIATLLVLILINFTMFSTKSFAALFNYVDLDDVNRVAMDRITRDVRQAKRVKSTTTTSLVLEDADGADLSYVYSPYTRLLVRTKAGSPPETILSECDRLKFDVRQRNPVAGSYDVYPAATPATAKVINVSWACSRTIMGRTENTESVQTARIVIRKQGT
jgi:hypothetical protein